MKIFNNPRYLTNFTSALLNTKNFVTTNVTKSNFNTATHALFKVRYPNTNIYKHKMELENSIGKKFEQATTSLALEEISKGGSILDPKSADMCYHGACKIYNEIDKFGLEGACEAIYLFKLAVDLNKGYTNLCQTKIKELGLKLQDLYEKKMLSSIFDIKSEDKLFLAVQERLGNKLQSGLVADDSPNADENFYRGAAFASSNNKGEVAYGITCFTQAAEIDEDYEELSNIAIKYFKDKFPNLSTNGLNTIV